MILDRLDRQVHKAIGLLRCSEPKKSPEAQGAKQWKVTFKSAHASINHFLGPGLHPQKERLWTGCPLGRPTLCLLWLCACKYGSILALKMMPAVTPFLWEAPLPTASWCKPNLPGFPQGYPHCRPHAQQGARWAGHLKSSCLEHQPGMRWASAHPPVHPYLGWPPACKGPAYTLHALSQNFWLNHSQHIFI